MMCLDQDSPVALRKRHTGTSRIHLPPCQPQVFSKADLRLWQQIELKASQRREGNR
jgi:hypothetical protein